MITEELKDKLNIEFRMDISHMFLGYENNMPLDEFNRMLDILVNKATKILITDRASEVGVQPEVMPKTCGQCKYYAKKISYCAKYDCNRVDTQAQPDYCKNDWFEYESK